MIGIVGRRLAALALALPLAIIMAGCSDDPVVPHDEELPHEMQLTIGGTVVTVTEFGSYTPNPVILAPGAHEVSVVFLDDDGAPMDIHDDDYRLDIISDQPAVVTYDASSAFTGTLTAVAAGSTTIRPQLFHIEEGHADFGPFPISVSVQ